MIEDETSIKLDDYTKDKIKKLDNYLNINNIKYEDADLVFFNKIWNEL
jgi:hypothetical protein